MNIAFLSLWFCPLTPIGVGSSGGMSIYILNFARELAKLDVKVDIYTHSHKKQKHEIISLHKNLRIIHLSNTKLDFAHNKYDILYSHYYLSGLAGLKISAKTKIPLFHTYHTLAKMKEIYAGIKDEKRFVQELEIVKKTKIIIASNELEKQDLQKFYNVPPSKIFIVQPGVNHHLFKKRNLQIARKRLDLPPDKKIILFIGRIDPLKGIKLLIDSFILLHHINPALLNKCLLLLIGGDKNNPAIWQSKDMNRINKLLNDHNFNSSVRFIGAKSHSSLPYYYAAANVVSIPSSYESFGLVALEAMACAKIVVATSVGGLRYLIKNGETGFLFDKGNKEKLAYLLNMLLCDNRYSYIGENAYQFSQKFSWNKQAKKLFMLFKKYS